MKDLNHVLYYEGKDAVLELIHNAKDTPVDSVSDFSDITNIDLDQIDGIKTGIHNYPSKATKFNATRFVVTSPSTLFVGHGNASSKSLTSCAASLASCVALSQSSFAA